jgi:hypothetical protein
VSVGKSLTEKYLGVWVTAAPDDFALGFGGTR